MRKVYQGLLLSLTVLSVAIFAQDEKVTRGKYLVEEVARCQDCHTPHLMGSGEIVKSARASSGISPPGSPTPSCNDGSTAGRVAGLGDVGK